MIIFSTSWSYVKFIGPSEVRVTEEQDYNHAEPKYNHAEPEYNHAEPEYNHTEPEYNHREPPRY